VATGRIITVQMITDEKGSYYSPSTIEASRGDVIRFTLKTGVHNVSFPDSLNSIKEGLPPSSSCNCLGRSTTCWSACGRERTSFTAIRTRPSA
jgi:plastocyanin